MSTAIVTHQGKTTIPEDIRQYLHLRDGDTVAFVINQHGQVILQPIVKRPLTDLKGLLGKPSLSFPRKRESIVILQPIVKRPLTDLKGLLGKPSLSFPRKRESMKV